MTTTAIWTLIWLVTGPLGAILDLAVESIFIYKMLPWNVIEYCIEKAISEMHEEGTFMSDKFMHIIACFYGIAGLIIPPIGWFWLKSSLTVLKEKRKEPSN